MSVKFKLYLDSECKCERCGSGVDYTVAFVGIGKIMIHVVPCEKCLDEVRP